MRFLLLSIFFALAFTASDVQGKKPDNKGGKPDKNDYAELELGLELGVSLISASDARALAVDTQATGYKPLPKGIRKNLARGKPMPPGIAKTRMPGTLLGRLPEQPGYEWRIAGSDLLLVQLQAEIVADVLIDVFR